jgi:hypothetical protein
MLGVIFEFKKSTKFRTLSWNIYIKICSLEAPLKTERKVNNILNYNLEHFERHTIIYQQYERAAKRTEKFQTWEIETFFGTDTWIFVKTGEKTSK